MNRYALFALVCLALVVPALAADPLWTHDASEPVTDCDVSSDGKVVVVSSDLVHLFDRKGDLIATTWRANDVALNPKGSLLVAATESAVRAVVKNGSEAWSSPNATSAVALSGDGGTVAAFGRGGLLSTFSAKGVRAGAADTGVIASVREVAVSMNGSVVVSIDGGGVRAFTRKMAKRWSVDLANPSALALNAAGDLVAVGDGGSVKFYNLTGERVGRLATDGRVRSLAMTPSANLTVAGVEDGTVAALAPDGAPLWNLSVGARVNRVAVSGSGAVVAAAASDRRLLVLAGNGTPLWEAPLLGEPRALALSADGTTVAVGCDQGTAYAFDTGVKPASAKTTSKATGTSTPKPTATGTSGVEGTPNETVTGSATAAPTTPLQLVVPAGTQESGPAPLLPAAALALLAVWAGLRRRG